MDEVIEEASKKYQGLVPLVYDIETMGLDEARPQDMPYAVYLKREADKVIADLEQKLAAVQLVLRLNKPEALYSNLETMSRLRHEIYVVERRERHQKYKRCLAMAEWCDAESDVADADGDYEDMLWYQKWHKRWLELAEKFKPNNSTAQKGKGKQN